MINDVNVTFNVNINMKYNNINNKVTKSWNKHSENLDTDFDLKSCFDWREC